MALQTPKNDSLVPLRRVLPVVGRNPGMAADRMVRGRLRFFVRTGWRIYVPHEDYVSFCEAAWNTRFGRWRRPTAPHAPEPEHDDGSTKPIHDGQPLDRYRRSPIVRLARAFHRWWRQR